MTPAPIPMSDREYKRLEQNVKGKGKKKPMSLEKALRMAKQVFDAAGRSEDLWMAKKYIEKALEILETDK